MKRTPISGREASDTGYIVMPLEGGIRFYAVVSPDGTVVGSHRNCATALAKARRLNRKMEGQTCSRQMPSRNCACLFCYLRRHYSKPERRSKKGVT
jgi:hypothetical protein